MSDASRFQSEWRKVALDYVGLLVALGLLVLVFSLATKYFFSAETFRTIANQIPAMVLLSTGMTYVLIVAEIDLSVGSVLGLCGAVAGVTMTQWEWPLWAALVGVICVGGLCGAFNGLVAVRWRLPSFIVTLATMEMARGGAHAITQSQTQYIGPAIGGIADTTILGLSLPFLFAILVVAGGQLVLSRAVFGRHMVASGANAEATRLSGIDPRKVKMLIFLISGVLVAIAAIIDTSRFQSANPNAGSGYELQAIAAAVIGGTSLMGGRGSVVRTFFGVLIIAVLNTGLATIGAEDEIKRLVTGAVIIAAVIVDHYRHRLSEGRA